MNRPLLVSNIIDYAAEIHPGGSIVSAVVEGGMHRTTYGDIAKRVASLAHGLRELGVRPGDRIATLAWNGYRHFELYYAISGIGGVCHTINPRLSSEQITYIIDHAQDKFLFFDLTFTPLIEAMHEQLPQSLRYVAMTDPTHMPEDKTVDFICYEDLLADQPNKIDWPEFSEESACALCYTSGTTGKPKGTLYSHRSTVLHTLFSIPAKRNSLRQDRTILPVVPLFHANAWGLPYSAPLTGTSLVLPGAKLDGVSLFELLDNERVFSAWGVPTVWLWLLDEMKERGRAPEGLAEIGVGGSAASRAMIEAFEKDFGIDVVHGWGMTEMSPVGTLGILSPEMRKLPIDEQIDIKTKQGRRLFGIEMKIVDESGQRLPHDGVATGELHVRGNTIAAGYYNNEEATTAALDSEGWFRTGDIASIRADSVLVISDRAKDLIKSGGEWISSIDVENLALGHPGIANCAVIAVPHPKWEERPLLVVVKSEGEEPAKDDILSYLAKSLAKWQVPDDIVFLEELPLTATGKVSKRTLRAQFSDYQLPHSATD